MRLFIAAELPNNLIEALSSTSSLLRESVRGRFVGSDQFHVTLAFLGNVAADRIALLEDVLDDVASSMAPIQVSLGPLGCFGKPKNATLWQGFSSGTGELESLANKVRHQLDDRGFDYDRKGFLPHVTLMRSANVESGILPPSAYAEGALDTLTLFQSELFENSRPQYTPLYSVMLRS